MICYNVRNTETYNELNVFTLKKTIGYNEIVSLNIFLGLWKEL